METPFLDKEQIRNIMNVNTGWLMLIYKICELDEGDNRLTPEFCEWFCETIQTTLDKEGEEFEEVKHKFLCEAFWKIEEASGLYIDPVVVEETKVDEYWVAEDMAPEELMEYEEAMNSTEVVDSETIIEIK